MSPNISLLYTSVAFIPLLRWIYFLVLLHFIPRPIILASTRTRTGEPRPIYLLDRPDSFVSPALNFPTFGALVSSWEQAFISVTGSDTLSRTLDHAARDCVVLSAGILL